MEEEIKVTETTVDQLDKDALLNMLNNVRTQNETIQAQLANMNKAHAESMERANQELTTIIEQAKTVEKYFQAREDYMLDIFKATIRFAQTDKILKELK